MSFNRLSVSVILGLTGFLQGACLILMGASSLTLKSSDWSALRDDQYGSLFVVMVIFAIISSVLTQTWVERFGRARVYCVGYLAFFLYVCTLYGLLLTRGAQGPSYILLILANLILGLGFGILCAMLNALIVDWYPQHPNMAMTGLHSCFGIGAGLTPLVVSRYVLLENWSGVLHLLLAGFLLVGILSLKVPLFAVSSNNQRSGGFLKSFFAMEKQARFFLLVILLYGCIEALVGNWTLSYLNDVKGVSLESASTALALFWSLLTVGRILASIAMIWVQPKMIYRMLPLCMAASFFALVQVEGARQIGWVYVALGLSFSSFFPLSVGIAAQAFPRWQAWLSSLSVTALMIGVGLGSFMPGWLRQQGWLGLTEHYQAAVGGALVLGVLVFLVTRENKPI